MIVDLHPAERPGVPVAFEELVAEARGFLAAAEANSTRRNYATDWRAFKAWCGDHGFESLPADPEVVALYLTNYARDHKASTVVRRAVGIAKGHRRAGQLSPTEHESVRLTRVLAAKEAWIESAREHGDPIP